MSWTRNYDNFVYALTVVNNSNSTTTPTTYDPPLRAKWTNGSIATISLQKGPSSGSRPTPLSIFKSAPNAMNYENSYSGVTAGYAYVMFGTGETAESYEDYKLDAAIEGGSFTALTDSLTESTIDGNSITGGVAVRSYQYTGSSPVTVKEFGVYAIIASSGSYDYPSLLYRKVLDAPITLEQYDRIEITVELPTITPLTPYPAA